MHRWLLSVLMLPPGTVVLAGNGNGNGRGRPSDPPTFSPSSSPSTSPTRAPSLRPTTAPPTVSIESCAVLSSISWKSTAAAAAATALCDSPCCEQTAAGEFTWPYTEEVTDQVTIRFVEGLFSLNFPLLANVGRLWVAGNDDLVHISLPNLRTAASVEVLSNEKLVRLDLPLLTSVAAETGNANFAVESNHVLESLLVPKLQSISAGGEDVYDYNSNLEIKSNPKLLELSFDDLVRVTSAHGEANVFLFNNAGMQTLSFPSLREVVGGEDYYGAFGVSNQREVGDALVELNLPKLASILPGEYSEFSVTYCDALAEIDVPLLGAAPTMFFRSMPALVDLRLPRWDNGYYLNLYPGSCPADREEALKLRLCSLNSLDDGIYFDLGPDEEECYQVKGTTFAENQCTDSANCNVFQATPANC